MVEWLKSKKVDQRQNHGNGRISNITNGWMQNKTVLITRVKWKMDLHRIVGE